MDAYQRHCWGFDQIQGAGDPSIRTKFRTMTPTQFRAIRAHLNWSLNRMADMLMIDVRTVRRYERGDTPITGTTQRCLEAFLSGYRPTHLDVAGWMGEHGVEALATGWRP